MNFHHRLHDSWKTCRLRRLWMRIDTACPYPIKSTGILAFGLVLVTILTIIGIKTDHTWYNPYTAYLILVALFFALIVMIWGTPFWTFRVVGVAFLVIGDVFIYGPLILTNKKIRYDETLRLALARAFFVVGAIFLVYGLSRWTWDYLSNRNSRESQPAVLTRPSDMLD